MGRAMWSGVISFGLVTIPVKLYTATESHSIGFHQLHSKCDTRIKEVRWCPHCDRQVDWDEIVKGYEYAKGQYVEVTNEDFDKLPLPSKHTIEVSDFVSMQEIDPIYFDSSYYLEADKSAQKAYKLLLEAMLSKGMAGIATIAFRSKERLCALRPLGGTLMLETLLYADEIKVDENAKAPAAKVSPQERKMAESLIDALTSKFQPEKFKDKYSAALKKVIGAKLKGVELKPAETSTPSNVADLMEALRASVENAKNGNAAKTGKASRGTKSKSTAAHKRDRHATSTAKVAAKVKS